MSRIITLGTGDQWDADAHQAIDDGCNPQNEDTAYRRSVEYISKFRERIPLARAIRLMCSNCMGGERDRMPQGEVARAIDECGSSMCPLWPFRFGRDPWREVSDAQRAAGRQLAAARKTVLET